MSGTLRGRFEAKVDRRSPSECWPWLGSIGSHGYGQVYVDGRPELAHRVAYALAVGQVPAGTQIDHVAARGCALKSCVNPAHLEPVTQQENIRRQQAAGRLNWETGQTAAAAARRARTHCKKGHEWTPENAAERSDGRGRRCRACARERRARA